MNSLVILAIIFLLAIAIGCYFLHKEFMNGEYLKIIAYSVAIFVVFVGVLIALNMILVSVASDRLPSFMKQAVSAIEGKQITIKT
jgi:hypothetical protein